MIKLRSYQHDCLEAVWSEIFIQRTALAVLPCGAGKTEIFIALVKRAIERKPDIKIVVLVERIGLLKQTARRLEKEIPFHLISVFGGGSKNQLANTITVSTIQSLYKLDIGKINLLILDECHHVDQEFGRYIDFIKRESDKNPKLKIVAFTATPYRSDGYIFGKDKLFPRVVYRRDLITMIKEGFLVPPRLKHTSEEFDVSKLRVRAGEYAQEDVNKLVGDRPKIEAQISDAIPRLKGRKKIVWACANIDHAEMVNDILRAHGEDAEAVHSKLTDDARDVVMFRFERGSARHLTNVAVLTEGYDYPPIDAIVLMRPIRSAVTYVQFCGRGLRLSPETGKADCLILDYGHVVENLGPLDAPIIPKKGQRKSQIKAEMKFCPSCFEFVAITTKICPICSFEFFKSSSDPTKSLSRTAATHGSILSSAPLLTNVVVEDCVLSEYISKNENTCLKISYCVGRMFAATYDEYFIWDKDFGRKKAYKRLGQLGVKLMSLLGEQIKQELTRKPSSIWLNTSGKYPAVISLEFEKQTEANAL